MSRIRQNLMPEDQGPVGCTEIQFNEPRIEGHPEGVVIGGRKSEPSAEELQILLIGHLIFLSILLVLTFFSNTIMNLTLPEVATDYISY